MIQPKVSIIIPFYNNLQWLREAIDSVLAQTYRNFEVILVNDGSKEDMTEILSIYGDKIIYVYQNNRGPAAARNNGIRHSTGDYIAFEDSDDIWLPTKLEKQISFMLENDAVWSHTGFYFWNPITNKVTLANNASIYDDIFIQRMITTKIATPSIVIKKDYIIQEGFYFPEEIRNGEDDRLYSAIASKYKIALIQEPLVKVRLRGNNSNTKVIERFHLRKLNYCTWKEQGVNIPLFGEIIYFFYRVYAVLFPIECQSNKFVNFLAKCFWVIPFMLERVYSLYLSKTLKKDKKFLKSLK